MGIKKLFFILPALMIGSAAVAASPRVINDELVQNLSCANITPDAIYKSIRNNAFEVQRQIMLKNFSNRVFPGQCWALARTQRLNLLLGRQDGTAAFDDKYLEALISGTAVPPSEAGIEPPGLEDALKFSDKPFTIHGGVPGMVSPITIFGQQLVEHFVREFTEAAASLAPLANYKTFSWPREGRAAIRRFSSAVQVAQARLFLRAKNIPYLFQDQSEANLIANLKRIAALARANKLPLINMRETRREQHVVVVSGFSVAAKDHYWISVIDSEAPGDRTKAVEVKRVGGRLRAFYGRHSSDIFLVEETERARIDRALVTHYKHRCGLK